MKFTQSRLRKRVNRGTILFCVYVVIGIFLFLKDDLSAGEFLCALGALFLLVAYLLPFHQEVMITSYEGDGYLTAQYPAFPFVVLESIKLAGYETQDQINDLDNRIRSRVVGRNAVCRVVLLHSRWLHSNSVLAQLTIGGCDFWEFLKSNGRNDDFSSVRLKP